MERINGSAGEQTPEAMHLQMRAHEQGERFARASEPNAPHSRAHGQKQETVVALAGNPNVGKSTVFNALTHMHQHTGNWPGKTVASAQGHCEMQGRRYLLVDTPGSYSLMAHSAEEQAARDFICFGGADAVVVVCDASCLERNLNLALQTMEITDRVVICVNLMDEARQRGTSVDTARLEALLGVPVVPAAARTGEGLYELMEAVARVTREKTDSDGTGSYTLPAADICAACRESSACRRAGQCAAFCGAGKCSVCRNIKQCAAPCCPVRYADPVEQALALLIPAVSAASSEKAPSPRWIALRLLEGDRELCEGIDQMFGCSLVEKPEVACALSEAKQVLSRAHITRAALSDSIADSLVRAAAALCAEAVQKAPTKRERRDERLDRILTSRRTGFPLMVLLLLFVFWLTITGANIPSQLFADGLFRLGEHLSEWLVQIGAPEWLRGVAVDGAYRVLAWVVSVMLPPMAIFFPLFTLLEDLGYLPRVAFNLDHCFQKCRTCGKQALTMAMGFGCNAAGVVGCRIIDSPRERLIAILTNSFVPCNGRFPTLIAILTMFFVGTSGGFGASLLCALMLTCLVLLGVGMTFLSSRMLSDTVLCGIPSSFTLELPPYRRPQVGRVLVRSVLDRTLFVLGRAAAVAAPAGVLLWCMANLTVEGRTLLAVCASALDPIARFIGLDGVILLAFLLGFPANEIVAPIIIMAYLSRGSLVEMNDLSLLRDLLVQNGWTWVTAVCTMLFSLMHWPCSTTCLTIYKETRSVQWTAAAVLLPTCAGLTACALVANLARLFAG